MALALYRKYRPKTFEEIVGQEHIVQTLTNALRLGRVGHAYLFVGPRGTGKTTVARLLARYVNCEILSSQRGESRMNPVTTEILRPARDEGGLRICDVAQPCINCAALFSGNNPDLIELDAASNRGIDEIRQLRESARVAPMQSPYKVYILDEAHMLTKDAANAFLKTLEEPPSHTMFILATTNVERVPATIISRCQRLDFRLLTVSEILNRLETIVAAERATIAADALELLANAADGSIRDGESLLEQTLAFLGSGATRDDVMRLLGIPDPLLVGQIADAILRREAQSALEGVAVAMERGGDATNLAVRLASYLRDVLLLQVDPALYPLIERRSGAAYAQGAREHAATAERQTLLALIPKFIDAAEMTKRSPIPQLPIELAVVEATSARTQNVA